MTNRIDAYEGKKIIGWKKAVKFNKKGQRYLVLIKLEIGSRTRRVQPKNKKCRAASARVLEITTLASNSWSELIEIGGRQVRCAFASYQCAKKFRYNIGKIVKPVKKFDPCTHDECRSGIHFFLTRREAKNYPL